MTTIVTIDMGGTGATHAAGAREALSVPSMTDMGQSYAQANTARDQANTARDQANTARDQANTARNTSNNAYAQANTGRSDANTTFASINTTFETVNTSLSTMNINLSSAQTWANIVSFAAYGQANTARGTANDAYAQANAGYAQANASYIQANAAYGAANTRLSASGGTLSGDLIITGNLTVSGNQTILNTEVLTTEDADIILLSNTSSTPALNAGLIVNRGTSTNTFLRWDEALDEWGWSDSGTTTYYFEDLRQGLSTTNTSLGTINTSLGTINTNYQAAYAQANDARGQANTAYGQANAAYGQANAAYTRANTKLDSAGGTISGNLTVTGSLTVSGNVSSINTQSISSVSNEIILNSNASGAPTLDGKLTVNRGSSANVTLLWNETSDKWGWTDNGATYYYFEDLRSGLATNNTTFGTINTSLGTINTSLGTINTSYQAAYAQANTAGTNALNAYGQANAARSDANTTFATINTTFATLNTSAGTQNSTFGTINTTFGTINTTFATSNTNFALKSYWPDATTQLGATAHGLTTFNTTALWSQPAGYETMVRADTSSGLPTSHGQSYFGYLITSRRDTGGGYSALLTAYDNSQLWFTYNTTNTGYPTWNKIWHENNDGSGSGLDADLWDGYQFTDYLNQAVKTTSSPTFSNMTVTGYITNIRNNGSVSAPSTSDHSLGTRITLYDATATSWYAIGIESDTMWFNSDNQYKWYVDAAQRMILDSSGNLTPSGRHYGNITSAGTGDSNAPFIFNADYSGWASHWAGTPGSNNGWGLFWAGNSGAQYGTNGTGGPGNIWSNSGNPNEAVFVGNGSTDWTLALNSGNVWQKGHFYCAGDVYTSYSDKRLKDIIGPITNAVEKIKKIDTIYYTANELAKSLGVQEKGVQVGVTSQSVKEVLPEVVVQSPVNIDYETVQYERIVPLLIAAIKEQQEQIEELKKKLGV